MAEHTTHPTREETGDRAGRGGRVRRTQEERSTETRRKLVDAAILVVQESGYANLTIQKVAQRAGMTNGAMQHHFPAREDLLLAVLDAVYPVLEMPFERIAARKLTIPQRMDTLVDLFWEIYCRPEYLVIWDVAFGTRNDPALRQRLEGYQRAIQAHLIKNLTALFPEVDMTKPGASQVFTLAISYLRGIALQAVFGVTHGREDLVLIKDMACERLARFLVSAE
ncbi:TetR/AcrR family transcriptional regulator [Nitrospirillum sp. BR 11163]|uniref:TetR/AcrR family transcriptional regulator n=1 Tax=Nitrospirillum sp. BR 11163 TaxID=3104323 RepID=UPI002AFFB842|nr:TetR/AcrR family transcriptional regulator [Nitrospirillum sp. BR 11163]MEA1672729.1 TetR/AcrR family transcriptional regulator [Nitrospirillum sp. BR 11163]